MPNEKRLIDANAIEAKIERNFRRLVASQNKPDLAAALSYVGDLIIEVPTVDAVEVVRCKDCKHWTMGYCNNFAYYDYEPTTNEDDFCSYGERRNDGNNDY